jgi:hypothetical protein
MCSPDADEFLMKKAIKDNQFWLKAATEGANSLLRAVSNAFYFTEVHHEQLQKKVSDYFRQQCHDLESRRAMLELLESSSWPLFLENPSLPEFETINLEILSRVLNCQIKLYFFTRGIISSSTYSKKNLLKIKVIKMFDNHYAALFPRSQKALLVECQSIVLSLVESAVFDSQFRYASHNKGKFINFELQEWKKNSGFNNANPLKRSGFDFKNFLFINPDLNQSRSDRLSSEPISENRSANHSSVDSVGSEIISILEQRRKENHQSRMLGNVESKFDFIINSSDHNSNKTPNDLSGKNRSGLNFEQNNYTSASRKRGNKTRPNYQKFTHLVSGMNSNLKTTVPLRNLKNIFGECKTLTEVMPNQQKEALPDSEKEDSCHSWDPLDYPKGSFIDDERVSPVHKVDPNFDFISTEVGRKSNQKNLTFKLEPSTDIWREDLLSLNPTHNDQHISYSLNPKPSSKLQSTAQPYPKNQEDSFHQPPSKPRFNSMAFMQDKIKNRQIDDLKSNHHVKADSIPDYANPHLSNHYQNPTGPQFFTPIPNPGLADAQRPADQPPTKPKNPKNTNTKKRRLQFRERHDPTLHVGFLKFFDEKNGFGFITVQEFDKIYDIFVYRVEFQRAKLDLNGIIQRTRSGIRVDFRFQIAYYSGKYEESKKAINIQLA